MKETKMISTVKRFFLERKVVFWICLVIWVLGIIYLVMPSPPLPPLPDSRISHEPGDTVEIPGVSAYYTNLSRQEVISFYRENFTKSRLWKLPLWTILLNHPPEYVSTAIRDTVNSTFLYELVHPLRDSLIINGWSPEEDRRYTENEKLIRIGKESYKQKITLRYLPSNIFLRVLIFSVGLWLFYYLWYKFLLIVAKTWKVLRKK